MDPVTQGALGAIFAQLPQTKETRVKEKMVTATWLGCAAGMAPDLDVFIQSPTDPLLFLEFHRHFTHSLIFIPIGAAIVALVLYRLVQHKLNLREAYFASLLGYATHGLLDACTTYGTQLFWPFSDERIAWNNVSVVDPMVTLPLLALVILAAKLKRPIFTMAGIGWVFAYLLFGVFQMQRAESVATELALGRGHEPQRLTLKASFANLIVWKSIYEHDDTYYVDGIRVAGGSTHCQGTKIAKLKVSRDLPFLQPDSQQNRDVERFRWFSDDYLAPWGTNGVTDIRYSLVPNQVEPMWGITLDPTAPSDAYVEWWSNRDARAASLGKFAALLRGEGCKPLS
ncbi:MAG: metal-dependent hydrolase [Pseudomonadales bacterium]|nr:metal-dependent hydrolase [Pseudomonadales bacterium]